MMLNCIYEFIIQMQVFIKPLKARHFIGRKPDDQLIYSTAALGWKVTSWTYWQETVMLQA